MYPQIDICPQQLNFGLFTIEHYSAKNFAD